MIGDAVANAAHTVADRLADRITAARIKIAAGIGIGLAVLGATISAAIGGFWWLQPQFGTVASALMVSGGFVVLALLLYIVGELASPSPSEPVLDVEPAEIAEQEGREAVDAIGPAQFVLAAAGIGALLGSRLSSSGSDARAGPSLLGLATSLLSVYSAVTAGQEAHKSQSSPANGRSATDGTSNVSQPPPDESGQSYRSAA